jgi:hypothetical protein
MVEYPADATRRWRYIARASRPREPLRGGTTFTLFGRLIRWTSDERTHLVGASAGINEVGVVAGALIGSMLIAGTLLVGAAGAHTTHPCPCRYSGGVAPPGAVICLYVDGKRSLARCEMVLNNPSWRFLHEPCPIASLTKPSRSTDCLSFWDRSTRSPIPYRRTHYCIVPRRIPWSIGEN